MAEQYDGVTIKLGLNTANIDRGMQALSRKMKTLNSEMKSHLSAFDMAEKSSDKYNGKIKILNKQLEMQGQKVASAENKLKSLKDEQTKANEKITESSQILEKTKTTCDKIYDEDNDKQIDLIIFGVLIASLDLLLFRRYNKKEEK